MAENLQKKTKKVVGVRFYPWDEIYDFDPCNIDLKINDSVVVDTEFGAEVGEVAYVDKEINNKQLEGRELKQVLRKTTVSDIEKIKKYKNKEKEAISICRELIKKHKLQMKLVDAHFSFDGSRIIFIFTAESRVDFRGLVKDLTRKFQKSVRMQQIGSRDEARRIGGYGLCGRELCCLKFLKEFKSISTDMARLQQMAHRGSERISGVCDRLLCCLSYEQSHYEELDSNMPKIGEIVDTSKGKGKVIEKYILKQTLRVKLLDREGAEIEVSLNDIK